MFDKKKKQPAKPEDGYELVNNTDDMLPTPPDQKADRINDTSLCRTDVRARREQSNLRRTGITTIMVRQAKLNTDLLLFGLSLFFFMIFGILFGVIITSAASEDLPVKWYYFLMSVFSLFVGSFVAILKVYAGQGVLSERLSQRVNRPKEELDDWGCTVHEK